MDGRIYLIDYNRLPTMQYRMNITTLELFLHDILDGTVTSYSISSLFQNDDDYIINIVFYPINLDDVVVSGSTSTDVYLGKKKLTDYTVKDIVLTKPFVTIATFNITRNFNNFLDFAPFTRIWLNVPFFEPIEIPTDVAYSPNGFDLHFSIDLFTNHATIYLEKKDGKIVIDSRSAKIGIEIPWGRSNAQEIQRNNVLQMISIMGGLVSTGVGIATNNPISAVAGIGMLTKNVTQALSNNVEHLTGYKGSTGNRDELCVKKDIYLRFERPTNIRYPDYNLRGGVCKKNLVLSNVTGYTEIGQIHLENFDTATESELNEIESLLRTGVIL